MKTKVKNHVRAGLAFGLGLACAEIGFAEKVPCPLAHWSFDEESGSVLIRDIARTNGWDGREIGSLQRPGTIALQPDVPAFIGSSSGAGDHFQGLLDEFRVYDVALSAERVASLFHAGVEVQQDLLAELEKSIGLVYVPSRSFAETLTATRKNIVERGKKFESDLVPPAFAKLKAAFPKEPVNFQSATAITPLEYMLSDDPGLNTRLATRLIELMLEYKPLTEQQWKGQKAQDLAYWAEADRIKAHFEDLTARGKDAQFSPEWVRVILDAGARIHFRPYQNEPVALYVRPETPMTRNLTAEEARQALERNWLHQADQNPAADRIRREIQWARDLAERLQSAHPSRVNFTTELAALKEMEQHAEKTTAPNRDLYFRVREVKRRIMLEPGGGLQQSAFRGHAFSARLRVAARNSSPVGLHGRSGGRLLVLEGLGPDGRLTELTPQAPLYGSFWRPDVSYDGRKIVFCFKPHNEKSFHLYEINADGTGLSQLTDGPFDDFDPIYLPDEKHMVFSTTRGHTYVRCMPPTSSFVVARCERDGSNYWYKRPYIST